MMSVPSLIENIYEAVLRPEAWQLVVRETARLLKARDGSFATYNFETKVGVTECLPIDPEYVRRYEEDWAHRNFLWRATHSLPVGKMFSFDAAMPRAQFEKTDFFNQWWLPQGMTRALGVNLVATRALSSVATFHRPSSRPDFDREDARRLRTLLPHLSRATEMRQQLEASAGDAEDFRAFLETLSKPAFLVDADCRMQFANSAAGNLLRKGDLKASANHPIVAGRADYTRMLHRLVGEVFRNRGAGGRLGLQRSNNRPITVTVSPLHFSASPFVRPSALILIDDPGVDSSSDGSAILLSDLYGLTRSEAQLALLIVQGMRLQQAAEKRGISLATAKTHLAHIFQKTDVATQGELIRLLIASGIFNSSRLVS